MEGDGAEGGVGEWEPAAAAAAAAAGATDAAAGGEGDGEHSDAESVGEWTKAYAIAVPHTPRHSSAAQHSSATGQGQFFWYLTTQRTVGSC
jgi:hypothetical protein